MGSEVNQLPLPVRLLNIAGKGASAVGWQPIMLKVEDLVAKAVENTGLTDLGDNEFRKPFELLLRSLEKKPT